MGKDNKRKITSLTKILHLNVLPLALQLATFLVKVPLCLALRTLHLRPPLLINVPESVLKTLSWMLINLSRLLALLRQLPLRYLLNPIPPLSMLRNTPLLTTMIKAKALKLLPQSPSLNVLPLRTRPKLQYNLNLHFSTPRPLLMTRTTCSGSNDLKRIIVHFRKKEDLDNATASPMDSLFGLHFHAYDPQAIKADEHARTLNLDSTWSVLCGGHCLRICPATFSPEQRAERCAYVALLAGLPRGTIAVDLAEIADEISAKSINVPFSMNSYNPKPYAYCHFASETAMENAKSISCALKKVGLTWHSPDEHLPPSHPAKRHNRFARPDNNNDGQSRTNASRHRSKSRPNN
ncbi:hypothetical protein GLOIN_2v1682945 [Rhizophagus irregularis DAOM 181602=DAOM 197198]|nr:hypothetical protein GLOIN_2v1682945 [Rhizophagus irregularis DAOM 181602=DAOM 197198]